MCAIRLTRTTSLPLLDHKRPEAVDYRWRDAANRLVHPHLLADCGPAQEDCGRIQLGGQCAFDVFPPHLV